MVADQTYSDPAKESIHSPLLPLVDYYSKIPMDQWLAQPETALFADLMDMGDHREDVGVSETHTLERQRNFLNLMSKMVTVHRDVFPKQVTQRIDGEEIPLIDSDTGENLKYGEILKGRSGPEHGPYGRYQRVNHVLDDIPDADKTRIAQKRAEVLQKYPQLAHNPNFESCINAAMSPHFSRNGRSRILSDYDLCSSERALYTRSLKEALEQKLDASIPDGLAQEIAQCARIYGGDISMERVREAMTNTKASYTQLLKADLKKHPEKYGHSLLNLGTDLKTKIGIAFEHHEPSYVVFENKDGKQELHLSTALYADYEKLESKRQQTPSAFSTADADHYNRLKNALGEELIKSKGRVEYFDAITDDPSLTPEHLTGRDRADKTALKKLGEIDGVTEEMIQTARQNFEKDSFNADKIIDHITRHEQLPEASRKQLQELQTELTENMRQALETMHAEDTAKKLAQTTVQSYSKKVGNIQDTARYLKSLEDRAASGDFHAKAMQQMTAVMFVTSGMSWDLNENTLAKLQEKEDPVKFAQTLDKKVYHSKLRDANNPIWDGENPGKAVTETLAAFEQGFAPIAQMASTEQSKAVMQAYGKMHETYHPALQAREALQAFTKEHKEGPLTEEEKQHHFTLVQAEQQSMQNYQEAFQGVHTAMENLVDSMPEMKAHLQQQGQKYGVENATQQFTENLTQQAEGIMLFNQRRKDLAQQQQQDKTHSQAEQPSPKKPQVQGYQLTAKEHAKAPKALREAGVCRGTIAEIRAAGVVLEQAQSKSTRVADLVTVGLNPHALPPQTTNSRGKLERT